MQQAQEQTGLADFGDDWFMGPLAAYVTDLEADHLSDFGRTFLARQAVKDLARRLRIIDCLARNPGSEETPIPPILYVTGHERSGTTPLHNLLALHSGARFLSRWELMMPTPPPEAASFQEDPRRLEVRKSIDALCAVPTWKLCTGWRRMIPKSAFGALWIATGSWAWRPHC